MMARQGARGSLRIEDMGFTYVSPRGEAVVAIERVDLDVEAGKFVCLLGPSGCGKTTLLLIVAGLLRPSRGKVFLDRTPLAEVDGLYRRIGVVFQEHALFPWLTVRDNIEFPLRIQGWAPDRRRAQVDKFVELVNLGSWAEKKPSQLSGGMKQRVGIARALSLDPELLLSDEPFGALDAQTRSLMQEELLRIWEHETKTVLFVTHSIPEAIYLADRIVVMTSHPGRVTAVIEVTQPRPRDVTSAEFNRVQRQVLDLLGPEIRKAASGPAGASRGRGQGAPPSRRLRLRPARRRGQTPQVNTLIVPLPSPHRLGLPARVPDAAGGQCLRRARRRRRGGEATFADLPGRGLTSFGIRSSAARPRWAQLAEPERSRPPEPARERLTDRF